jgi:hypothetical protein
MEILRCDKFEKEEDFEVEKEEDVVKNGAKEK